jgi:zinc transport system substrate-binding protein
VTTLLLCLAWVACSPPGPDGNTPLADDRADSRLVVYTVNYPLAYFAERIGGDLVRVEFPAPTDVDPAFWSPEPETVAAYQQADLILLNGAGYAGWTDRATLPPSRVVDTSAGFRDRYIEVEGAATHAHGPEGEHEHGTTAFTTWLDPTLALEQSRAIRDALSAARPEHGAPIDAGYASLEQDLAELDRSLRDAARRLGGRPVVGSHPVYQYLAARYGLALASVHFEPDSDPGPDGWSGLRELLDRHPARLMLWEGEPLAETRRVLADAGLQVVVYEPCGNRPVDGDWLSVARANLAYLERSIDLLETQP